MGKFKLKLSDRYLIGAELSELVAEFDRIEAEITNLGKLIGTAYGPDWRSRGLRIAQLVRALRVRVEDHGYDCLSSQDRALFQNVQRDRPNISQIPSALEISIGARKAEQRRLAALSIVENDNEDADAPRLLQVLMPDYPNPADKNGQARMKRGTTQFAALPWRIGPNGTCQVMLLTSRETRRWIIPKGWPIRGQKPARVAGQEAYEEAGLRGRVVGKRPIGSFHYEKGLPTGRVLCTVKVYLFCVEQQDDDWPEKPQRETRWFDVTEAAEYVEEIGLAEIIRRFATHDTHEQIAGSGADAVPAPRRVTSPSKNSAELHSGKL
jgi:8-oxo-dGTP pyrophosphatase MutT (NUDIX family)